MNNAEAMDAYSMEEAVFTRVMGIGLATMKGYLMIGNCFLNQ